LITSAIAAKKSEWKSLHYWRGDLPGSRIDRLLLVREKNQHARAFCSQDEPSSSNPAARQVIANAL